MLRRQYRQQDIPENDCNPVWSEMSEYIFLCKWTMQIFFF